MIKSQSEDISVLNEEIAKAINDTESIKLRLAVCQLLAEKQAEEIAFYERMKKRLRAASYVEFGVGVPCLVIGLLPIWTDEQQNIKNIFLGIGATGTAAGAATFVFTIHF